MMPESSFSDWVSFLRALTRLGFGQPLLDHFLLAGLDGEVGLGEGNLLLGRIAVLGDQVAGIARQSNIVDFPLGTRAEIDHFPDIKKMVLGVVTGGLASSYGLVDNLGEVLPFRVSQEHLEVSRTPELRFAVGELTDHLLETGVQPDDDFFVHRFGPIPRREHPALAVALPSRHQFFCRHGSLTGTAISTASHDGFISQTDRAVKEKGRSSRKNGAVSGSSSRANPCPSVRSRATRGNVRDGRQAGSGVPRRLKRQLSVRQGSRAGGGWAMTTSFPSCRRG